MKKNNKKGFTLAELLIVVAIIAVLTAIAIPVFTAQLEKSREATDMSNLRAAYAEVMAAALTQEDTNTTTGVTRAGSEGSYTWSKDVVLKQAQADWQTTGGQIGETAVNNTNIPATVGATITVTFTQSTGKATFAVKS